MSPERLARFKKEIIAALVFDVVALLFIYGPGLPFHPRLAYVIWASVVLHLAALACFDAACKDGGRMLSFFTLANVAIMVPALHYTGGAASPFVFVLVAILVSRAAYGIQVRYEIAAAAAAYFGVVASEASGLLEPWPLTARELYSSVPALLLVGANMLSALLCAGLFYRDIFSWLTESLSKEQAAKSNALRELVRVDPTTLRNVVVAKLSHDINNRLTSLSAVVGELESARSGLPQAVLVNLVDAKRDLKLVCDLNNRVRNFSEGREETPRPLDLWPALQGALAAARHLPGADRVDLLLGIEPPRPVKVLAYTGELERACLNVVKNAVEAALNLEGQRSVKAQLLALDGHAVVSVSDDGPGMPAELQARVLKGGVTTKPEGRGLGLVIASEVCSVHGGRLSIDSAPGRGTVVTLSIPLATKEAVPA